MRFRVEGIEEMQDGGFAVLLYIQQLCVSMTSSSSRQLCVLRFHIVDGGTNRRIDPRSQQQQQLNHQAEHCCVQGRPRGRIRLSLHEALPFLYVYKSNIAPVAPSCMYVPTCIIHSLIRREINTHRHLWQRSRCRSFARDCSAGTYISVSTTP